jgi:hypothetical protein
MDVAADPTPEISSTYSEVRDALDNELTLCREKLRRDIRRAHRRWNTIEKETHHHLSNLGYLPNHSKSPFKKLDKPNTSTTTTLAKTKVFSPNRSPENVLPDYHHIIVSNAFEAQSPVPSYRHCHSTAYNIRTKNRKVISLTPEGTPEDEEEKLQSLQNAVSSSKYFVLGFERSYALAVLAQRVWYFEPSITRLIESYGLNLQQIHEIMHNQFKLSQGRSHVSGKDPNDLKVSLIARAVKERCKLPLNVALSYWLRPDVDEMTCYCRICKK